MKTMMEWISSMKACDVMSRDVEVISYHAPVDHAARLFQQKHISGAPVVDDQGVCVGVITASDVISFDVQLCEECNPEAFKPQPDELVGRLMSRNAVCVRENTPVEEILAELVQARIHRVVVVDEENHVVGIVSTTDIVAALLTETAREESLPAT